MTLPVGAWPIQLFRTAALRQYLLSRAFDPKRTGLEHIDGAAYLDNRGMGLRAIWSGT
jgi:hypothetical protein